jgi:hypothetical protein
MGPLSTLLIQEFQNFRKPLPEEALPLPEIREKGMTKLQIRALNHVSKGNIRPASDHFCLILKEGVFGRGGYLFKARFSPVSPRSRKNAEIICREVAKGQYRFDFLFVDDGIREERIKVLCPHCREYWNWKAYLPNDLRRTQGRVCRYCG